MTSDKYEIFTYIWIMLNIFPNVENSSDMTEWYINICKKKLLVSLIIDDMLLIETGMSLNLRLNLFPFF